jgi:hypothetical protein
MPAFRNDDPYALRDLERLKNEDRERAEQTRVHFSAHLEGSEIDQAIELNLTVCDVQPPNNLTGGSNRQRS